MNDAVAVILTRVSAEGFFIGAEYGIETGVTDGVNADLQTVFVGAEYQIIHQLLTEYRQTTGGFIVGIRAGQVGSSRAESAVTQHFQRAGFEQLGAAAGAVAGVDVFLQVGNGSKVSLLINTDSQLAVTLQFLIGFVDGLPWNGADAGVVIGLGAGDTEAVESFAGEAEHIFYRFLVWSRSSVINRVHGIVEELTVWHAVFHGDEAALRLRGVSGDAKQLDDLAVYNKSVTAGAGSQNRNVGGDLVQIPAGRHPFFVAEVVLIPTATTKPAAFLQRILRKKVLQAPEHIGKTAGVLRQRGNGEHTAEAEQMHMAVIEARADEPALQVDEFIAVAGQSLRGLVAAAVAEAAVFHNKGLAKWKSSAVNLSIKINMFHI